MRGICWYMRHARYWTRDRMRRRLKAVYFQLLRFRDSDFSQELDDVIPLIALQLNDFTIFLVLDDCAVARELLSKQRHGSQYEGRGRR